jgi:hypothetical protein
MTAADWGTLIAGLVPFLIALTAWLRAETANRNANSARATSTVAKAVATAANVRSQSVANAVGTTPTDGDTK